VSSDVSPVRRDGDPRGAPDVDRPIDAWVMGRDIRLHYLDWGTGTPPFVFVHGAGLSAASWYRVMSGLRERNRCLALDLRGHGDSEWSSGANYLLEDYLSDLQVALAQFGDDPFVLVGSSLGGQIALAYAAAEPGRVAGLVLVDSGPRPYRAVHDESSELLQGPITADSIDEFVDRAVRAGDKRSRERIRESLERAVRKTPDGKWTWKFDSRAMVNWASVSGSAAAQADFERRRLRLVEDARRVTCPTLVVRGALSTRFLEEDAAALVKVLSRGRSMTIEGAGHIVQRERPEKLAAALRDFVQIDIAAKDRL
jgi:esterase